MNNYDMMRLKKETAELSIGREIYYYDELSSTMHRAKSLAFEGVGEGAVVLAGRQNAGRGRFERVWLSPIGNIYASIILKPDIEKMPLLFAVSGLAVKGALAKEYGIKASLKWPNDVQVNGLKICGTLIEGYSEGGVTSIICGVGLNANFDTQAHEYVRTTATSISDILGRQIDINEILISFLKEFDKLYINASVLQIYDMWRASLSMLGEEVCVRQNDNSVLTGKAIDVAIDGRLLLQDAVGVIHSISNGDIFA